MLKIRQIKHLAASLSFDTDRLQEIADQSGRYCEELILIDPAKPLKPRPVLNVKGDLRKAQERLLRMVFMRKLAPSQFSHGGVRGRHILTNLATHLGSVFVFTGDITNFYPSISHNRIYRLFVERFQCSPDVARICTKLCTFGHHLALGLITSPFLADQVLMPVDRRIAGACQGAGLVYSRFVDDIAISGNFDLQESGFESLVRKILDQSGFIIQPEKIKYGSFSKGAEITKITIRNAHPDVRREFIAELERELQDAGRLGGGGQFTGPYFTRNQIAGRIQFVCWVNPSRRKRLLSSFYRVPWEKVELEADARGLVASKKTLVKAPIT
jgi:RNA-directed DNA polymerase